MPFVELDEVFEDFLPLPVSGKIYRVPPTDGETGIWCQRLMSTAVAVANGGDMPADMPKLDFEGEDEIALYQRLLGPVWDELHADGVSWPRIMLIAQTAFIWAGSGRTIAEEYWNSGGTDPKALTPNRKARRSAGTTSTGAAGTTRKPASTSGTKRQPKSTKR